jgi:hypothetical protein
MTVYRHAASAHEAALMTGTAGSRTVRGYVRAWPAGVVLLLGGQDLARVAAIHISDKWRINVVAK